MKKINILLTASILLSCYACDMDKLPQGQLETDKAIETLKDCRNYRNGIYATLRGITTGGFAVYSDIQTDGFHSVIGNGGLINAFYTGSLQPEMEVFETVWGGNYSTIGSANFIINKMDDMAENNPFTDKERLELQHYLGEALFTRAYCYFDLAQKFCAAYNPENANTPYSGLPLTIIYAPTDNNDKYPGRSTLEETYKLINDDLELALEYLLAFEARDEKEEAKPKAMSSYITSDAVKAMQARVALTMRNYNLAMKKAEEVINTSRYGLISSSINYFSLWRFDTGSEAIWRVSMTSLHMGFATGDFFLATTNNPPFIPTAATVELFDKEKDIRFDSYFIDRTISTSEGTGTVSAFGKYPGNPNLFTTGTHFKNMSKPFRIAEQYLIAAEAAAMLGQNTKANKYLNDLRLKRISGYKTQQYIGEMLMNAIRDERRKELIGEGFRLSDLKRWGLGFKRSSGQNNAVINKVGDVHLLEYAANDYRFIWPIPKAEMDSNPQLKNHQNPGY